MMYNYKHGKKKMKVFTTKELLWFSSHMNDGMRVPKYVRLK